jgi:hypothetical protein
MKTKIITNAFIVLVPFLQNKKDEVVELTSRQSVFLEVGGFIKLKPKAKPKTKVNKDD